MEDVANPIFIDGDYCPRDQKPYPCLPSPRNVLVTRVRFEDISGTVQATTCGPGWRCTAEGHCEKDSSAEGTCSTDRSTAGIFQCSAGHNCTGIELMRVNLTGPGGSQPTWSCTRASGSSVDVQPPSCL